jgi:tetratricopeptide (TPR) repeat protein
MRTSTDTSRRSGEVWSKLAWVWILAMAIALTIAFQAKAADQEPADRKAELFEQSFSQEAIGALDKALNSCLEILRLDPKDYVATLRAGWLNHLRANYDEAIRFYRAAVELHPVALEPKLGLMLPLMAVQRFADAEVLAREVLRRSPRLYVAASRLAFILFSQGRLKDAEAQYQQVLDDYPSDLDMMLGLAWTYLKQGRKDAARVMFNQVLQIRRGNLNAKAGLQSM